MHAATLTHTKLTGHLACTAYSNCTLQRNKYGASQRHSKKSQLLLTNFKQIDHNHSSDFIPKPYLSSEDFKKIYIYLGMLKQNHWNYNS